MVFERIDRGLRPVHVVVFVVIAAVLGAYLLFISAPHLRNIAPEVTLLDMHYTGYHEADVVEVREALGADGRSYYATNHLIVDLLFAPALFLAITGLFLLLSQPGRRFSVPLPEGIRLVVVSLALAGLAADIGENICIWLILASDAPASGLVTLGSTFTAVKFLGYSAAIAALAATVILALFRGLSGGSQSTARA